MNSEIAAGGVSYRRVPWAMVIIALLAVPIAFIQANMNIEDPIFLTIFTFGTLGSVGLFAYWFVFRHLPPKVRRSPYLIFFSIFAFATMRDLLIALTLLGVTDVRKSYFEVGEPYLQSSYSMGANLWDGTVHLALYAWMGYWLAQSISHHRSALFWAGSMTSACVIFLLANLIGEYAEHITLAYSLNLPFLIIPIFYGWKVIQEDPARAVGGRRRLQVQDYALAVALLAFATACAYRLLAVLNPDVSLTQSWVDTVEPYLVHPSRFPQMQMLSFGMVLMPFSVLAAIALWRSPSRAIAYWGWILAGFVAQGQFVHIAGSIDAATVPDMTAAGSAALKFWGLNILVMLVPLWFAWRYESHFVAVSRA